MLTAQVTRIIESSFDNFFLKQFRLKRCDISRIKTVAGADFWLDLWDCFNSLLETVNQDPAPACNSKIRLDEAFQPASA